MSEPVVLLPGTRKNTEPLRGCSKCGQQKEPAGGVQMSATKWRCAACWRGFMSNRK